MQEIKELCELNLINYHISEHFNERVLINDEFWFYINDKDCIKNFNTYVDIIKGRNEIVNIICDKLNTTIEKGCDLKLFEFHQNEMVLINDNSIVMNINNSSFDWQSKLQDYILTEVNSLDDVLNNETLNTHMKNMDNICFTQSNKFINITLKIVLNTPLEYYLISENKIESYKIKSAVDLKYVLDQMCLSEHKKCDRDRVNNICENMVNINKGFPNPNGLCSNETKYMSTTSQGYRNNHTSFLHYYFCSKDCMDYFNKYNKCNRCSQDGKGTYVEELGYTLCNGRGDYNPPCIMKYKLEKQFTKDYEDNGFYEISGKLKNILLDGCDELKKIISDNGNKINLDMLLDLDVLQREYITRDRSNIINKSDELNNELSNKEMFEQYCEKILEEY